MQYRFLRYPGGKAKAVTFSYDDGCRDDIRLSKILTEHGIRCILISTADYWARMTRIDT